MEVPFFSGLSKLKINIKKNRRDDDQADRYSHLYTTIILVSFSLIVSTRQYIIKPIACWVPVEFSSSQEEYAESMCWVGNTYFINPNMPVPEIIHERENKQILYYQWVPFILLLQAIIFNLPCLTWRLFNWQSGLNLSNLIETGNDIETSRNSEDRKMTIDYMASRIIASIDIHREYRNGCMTQCKHCIAQHCCLCFGKRYGNYLICTYILCKGLYVVNIIGQFFMLNSFLGINQTLYGFNVAKQLSMGVQWTESGNFPRVTLCDFIIRKLANQHRYTVQCALPLNMFNEKIFLFLWFWFMFILSISIYSFIYWIYISNLKSQRYYFIRKFLTLRDALQNPGDRKKIQTFVDLFLQQDGVFVIRLLSINCGHLIASEVIENMWHRFRNSSKYYDVSLKYFYEDKKAVNIVNRLRDTGRNSKEGIASHRRESRRSDKKSVNSHSNSNTSASNKSHSSAGPPFRSGKKSIGDNKFKDKSRDSGEYI